MGTSRIWTQASALSSRGSRAEWELQVPDNTLNRLLTLTSSSWRSAKSETTCMNGMLLKSVNLTSSNPSRLRAQRVQSHYDPPSTRMCNPWVASPLPQRTSRPSFSLSHSTRTWNTTRWCQISGSSQKWSKSALKDLVGCSWSAFLSFASELWWSSSLRPGTVFCSWNAFELANMT